MGFLEIITDPVWLTGIGGLLATVSGYFVARSKNKKELAISDRVQLSKDQYQLIAELRAMMVDQKEELESLRDEIKHLQEVNINLTIQNKEFQTIIDELNRRLGINNNM